MNTTTNTKKWSTGYLSWRTILTLSLLLMMFSWSARKAEAQEVYVPEVDSLALVDFYHSMSGEDWLENGGWLEDRVDTWHGITTDNMGTEEEPEWRVVAIKLNDNMTQPGTIPAAIGDLEFLKDIVLRGDAALHGEWPKEVENLVNLREIRTQGTNMTGEIPWNELSKTPIQIIRLQNPEHYGEIPDQIFADMTQVYWLQMNDMYLSGDMPSSLTELVDMSRFRFRNMLIEGDVPDLGNWEEVDQFHLSGLNLTPGPIYPWLENFGEDLRQLWIQNSNRTGSIPEWLTTNMFALEEVEIGELSWDLDNALGGDVPDFSNYPDFEILALYGPHWEGTLPEWLGTSGMDRVFFYYTKLSGDIPASYANITDQLYIEHSPDVTGGIPAQFELFTGRDFALNMNDSWDNLYERFGEEAANYYSNPSMEVGELPSYMGTWSTRNITLSNVGVTGSIPDELADIGGLSQLDLSHNPGLTGGLPSNLFTGDIAFSVFNLSHTGLDISEVPTELQNHNQSLASLGLAGLGIEGGIPSWIGDLSLLQSLDLSNNSFTGSIPSNFGDLKLMNSLNLANNQLSGDLPASFVDVGYLSGFYALTSLDLSGNVDLSGEIPLRFSESENMKVMRYDDTGLWAPDNNDFTDWLENEIPSNSGLTFPAQYVDVQTSGLVGGPATSAEHSDRPYVFKLEDNYPNPFNPTTTLSYQIPEEGHVTLSIYNVLGQEVTTLVNEVQSAGNYEITFDASSLSSGTYLYRLKSGNRVMTRNMMLIK